MQAARPVTAGSQPNTLASAETDLSCRFSAGGRARSQWRAFSLGLRRKVLAATGAVRQPVEAALAIVLFLLASPALIPVLFAYGRRGFCRSVRLGRECRTFHRYEVAAEVSLSGLLSSITSLLNIARGEMSFVGPRPMPPETVDLAVHYDRRRHAVRPGLICLWWVRERTNIAYGSEQVTDVEYVESSSFRHDLALLMRAIPAMLYGVSRNADAPVVRILGIPIQNLTMDAAVEWICRRALHGPAAQVSFVNPHCANIAAADREYHRILLASDLNLGDGIGIKLAGRLLGTELRQNVNGTDLFPQLLRALSGTGIGVYLLGGRPGVPDAVRDWIHTNHPGVVVSGSHHGYFAASECGSVLDEIKVSGAAVLIVAFGVPQQEKWIHDHMQATGVRVALGVGGLFDFYSGRIPRAPMWMREIGLEWIYRFLQEPRRMWKRYFVGNVVFLWRVMRQKFDR